MKIVNLTEHPLNIHGRMAKVGGGGPPREIIIPPSRKVARVEEVCDYLDELGLDEGMIVIRGLVTYGPVMGFPEKPESGVIYVVSRMVRQAMLRENGSQDPYHPGLDPLALSHVMCPGPPIRDKEGRITGCLGLSY